MSTATALLGLLQASLRTRQRLVVENLALRHQLVVLKRSIKRPRIEDCDRIFWILLRRTFLANHMDTTIACDFFTVPTVTFRNLHVNVTEHPTAEWTALQLVEAVSGEGAPEVTHLILDRDSIFGDVFQRKVAACSIDDIVRPRASPWCNGFAQRVIGTVRRESVDHVVPLGQLHFSRLLREFVAYYNSGRCHQSLGGDAPVPRQRWSKDDGAVQAKPVLGGLHHVHSRAA
jgi:transposase InsO family protein